MTNPSIVFANPGVLDPRCITTLGVNVKEHPESAVGWFGTGLKYAIAVLLREGCEVRIFSGGSVYDFETTKEEVRGKEFQFIWMWKGKPHGTAQRLGFTTELGKNWDLKAAYRELHSNCLDEGGAGGLEENSLCSLSAAKADWTYIFVTGGAFSAVHHARDEFILPREKLTLLYSFPHCEIYAGRSTHAFYRGFAVCKLPQPAAFTYNILEWLPLTEDRTVNEYYVRKEIIRAIACSAAPDFLIEDAITRKESFEQRLDATEHPWSAPLSENFLSVLGKVARDRPLEINEYMQKLHNTVSKSDPDYAPAELTGKQKRLLADCIELAELAGFAVRTYQIKVVKELGDGILGLAKNGKIWVAEEGLASKELLLMILLEEFIHLHHAVGDATHQMQRRLMEHLGRLVRELALAREVSSGVMMSTAELAGLQGLLPKSENPAEGMEGEGA